jgi:hypothetical protein
LLVLVLHGVCLCCVQTGATSIARDINSVKHLARSQENVEPKVAERPGAF